MFSVISEMRLHTVLSLVLALGVFSVRQQGELISDAIQTEQDGVPIKTAHYNMLASYLGNNDETWFLYPLQIDTDRRDEIFAAARDLWAQQATAQKAWEAKADPTAPKTWTARNAKNGFQKEMDNFTERTIDSNFFGMLTEEEVAQVREWNNYFAWENRGPKVMELMKSLDADILSVVELDVPDEMHQALGKDVYDVEWRKRPRKRSKDGCGIFWKKERFELAGNKFPVLNMPFKDFMPDGAPEALSDVEGSEDRIMLGVPLREKTTGEVILAISTHLMKQPADEKQEKIRVEEIVEMMNMITHYAHITGAVGIVIMGDFNAAPDSLVHILLEKTWLDCGGNHKLMKDAHRKVRSAASCTTRTTARQDVIDYIYYTKGNLELLKEQTSPETCPNGPIPDESNPSDHTPIWATFNFKKGPAVETCEKKPPSLLEVAALKDA